MAFLVTKFSSNFPAKKLSAKKIFGFSFDLFAFRQKNLRIAPNTMGGVSRRPRKFKRFLI
jgi:hypothetical protein